MLAVTFLSVLLAAAAAPTPGPQRQTLELGTLKATIEVPKHDAVTLESEKEFLFFSIKAGYESDTGAYITIPAEASLAIWPGTLDDAMKRARETKGIPASRDVQKEIKLKDGGVVWLLKEKNQDAKLGLLTNRAVQFVPGDGAVLVIDATGHSVRGMPVQNRKGINGLLLGAIKSIKVGDKPVIAKEVLQYVELK